MPSDDFDARATELLRSAPGPAPWLCRTWIAPPGLRWDESEGVARGMSESGQVIFWFPMYTALVGAAAGEVSVARPSRDLKVTTYRFDLQTPEIADGWGVTRGPEAKVVTNASVASVVDLVLGTPGGERELSAVDLPSLPDVIGLPGRGPAGSAIATSLYVWWPRRGRVLTVPLPWFTAETVDLGYQWVTRCAYDPDRDWIFADGIRVGRFAVDLRGEVRWGRPLEDHFAWPRVE